MKVSADLQEDDSKSEDGNGRENYRPSRTHLLSPSMNVAKNSSVTSHYNTAGRRQLRRLDEAIHAIAEYGKNVQLALDQHSRDIRAVVERMTKQNELIMDQNYRIEEHSEFLLTLHHGQLNTQAHVEKLGQHVEETRAELREVKRRLERMEERQHKSSGVGPTDFDYRPARDSNAGAKRFKYDTYKFDETEVTWV